MTERLAGWLGRCVYHCRGAEGSQWDRRASLGPGCGLGGDGGEGVYIEPFVRWENERRWHLSITLFGLELCCGAVVMGVVCDCES